VLKGLDHGFAERRWRGVGDEERGALAEALDARGGRGPVQLRADRGAGGRVAA
jgi:hypothetical protein